MKTAPVINVTCASLRGANISFPCDIKAENFVSVKSWKFNDGGSLARPRKINLTTARRGNTWPWTNKILVDGQKNTRGWQKKHKGIKSKFPPFCDQIQLLRRAK